MSKFYKHTYKVVVLSEDIHPDEYSLDRMAWNTTYGNDCLHTFSHSSVEALDKDQMSDMLIDAGSEPEFFGIGVDDE